MFVVVGEPGFPRGGPARLGAFIHGDRPPPNGLERGALAVAFSEPTCEAASCRVWPIAWIACWPDWKLRSEVIISTIVLAASTPEPSSEPWRRVPLGLPAAVPVYRFSPCLTAPGTSKMPTALAGTVPLALTLICAPPWSRTGSPLASVSTPAAEVVNCPSRV